MDNGGYDCTNLGSTPSSVTSCSSWSSLPDAGEVATATRLAVSGRLLLLRGPVLGLLLRSRPKFWRPALRDFLGDYVAPPDKRGALYFLFLLMRDARMLKLREPDVLHYVPVELDHQPGCFRLDKWRHLMESLGFIQDDDEDVRMCSVFLHESLSMPVLVGFYTFIQSLLALNHKLVKGLFSLGAEEAASLKNVIRMTLFGTESHFRPVWGTQVQLLEKLGLLKVRRTVDELTYKLEYSDFVLLPEIYTVLLALHGTAFDVVQETTL